MSLESTTLEDIAQSFKLVGDACGVEDRGEQLCTEFLQSFSALREITLVASSASRPPKVLILEWLDPPFDAGIAKPNHFNYISTSALENIVAEVDLLAKGTGIPL